MTARQFELRPAHADDVEALSLVLLRAIAQRDATLPPEHVTVDDEALGKMQGWMNKPSTWTYVLTDEEKMVGFAMGRPQVSEDDPSAPTNTEHLSLLMIDPDYWGKRLASRLLDVVAEHSRASGRQKLTLWTGDTENAHARGVYEHRGFSLTGLTRDSEYGYQVQYALDL